MSKSRRSLWVISDGRRGIENQALGLAEACSRVQSVSIQTHVLNPKGPFKALPPKIQWSLKSSPDAYGLTPPFPDIVIGCGRQAIAPLLALKAQLKSDIFTVYIQDPRIDVSGFDLVIAPEHDQLPGNNVVAMIGSPNRITDETLIAAETDFEPQLSQLTAPKIAMLIGGPSKSHKLTPEINARHLDITRSLLKQGHSLLITTSRRTPISTRRDYRELAAKHSAAWLYEGDGANPYFAFLSAANAILVTEESTNMLTEACATGKPVFRLPMAGKPGKFQMLYDALQTRCHVGRFDGGLTAAGYPPLRETDRVAHILWERAR